VWNKLCFPGCKHSRNCQLHVPGQAAGWHCCNLSKWWCVGFKYLTSMHDPLWSVISGEVDTHFQARQINSLQFIYSSNVCYPQSSWWKNISNPTLHISSYIIYVLLKTPVRLVTSHVLLKSPVRTNTGWWFGTLYIFPYIGNNHPNWFHIFLRDWNHQPEYH